MCYSTDSAGNTTIVIMTSRLMSDPDDEYNLYPWIDGYAFKKSAVKIIAAIDRLDFKNINNIDIIGYDPFEDGAVFIAELKLILEHLSSKNTEHSDISVNIYTKDNITDEFVIMTMDLLLPFLPTIISYSENKSDYMQFMHMITDIDFKEIVCEQDLNEISEVFI